MSDMSHGMHGIKIGEIPPGGIVIAPATRDHGPFVLPANHQPAMRVPRPGSSCANCAFGQMRADGPHCTEAHFVLWNRGSKLPVKDPHDYCSDWYQPTR